MRNLFFALAFMILGIAYPNTQSSQKNRIVLKKPGLTEYSNIKLDRTTSYLALWDKYSTYNFVFDSVDCSWNISIFNANGELVAASVGSASVSSFKDCDKLVRDIEAALIAGIQ